MASGLRGWARASHAKRHALVVVWSLLAGSAGCAGCIGVAEPFTLDETGGGGASSSASTSNASSSSTGTGGAATRTVEGNIKITYVGILATTLHSVDVPVDLSNATILAYSEVDGQTHTASGKDDGTFTIQGVPEGYYRLLIDYDPANTEDLLDDLYFVTSESNLSFNPHVLGREGNQVKAGVNTKFTLNIGMLSSWTDSDRLELVSGNAGTGGLHLTSNTTMNPPLALETELAMTIDVSRLIGPYPIDSSKGDLVGLMQLTQQTNAASFPFLSLVRYVGLTGVMLPSGGTYATPPGSPPPINFGDPTTVPANQMSTNLKWSPGEFEQFATTVGGTPAGHTFKMQLLLGEYAYGNYTDVTPDLLIFTRNVGSAEVDTSFDYVEPIVLDPAWKRFGSVVTEFDRTLTFAGSSLDTSTNMYVMGVPTDFDAKITADLPPPQSARVDGTPLVQATDLTSRTPTVSWNPASNVTSYKLRIFRLEGGAQPKRTLVATIKVPGTFDSVTVPDNVLQPNAYYQFALAAHRFSGVTYEQTPDKESLPAMQSPILSGALHAP